MYHWVIESEENNMMSMKTVLYLLLNLLNSSIHLSLRHETKSISNNTTLVLAMKVVPRRVKIKAE